MQDLRALVVDDSKVGRLTMQRKLETMGIRVDLAESGPQALEWLTRQRPDLIFMDHMMPDMDGFEVTRRIKADPALRDIPVIIVSGNDEASFVEAARQAGAIDAMAKPPATEALESLLACLPLRAGETAAATSPLAATVAPAEPRVDVGALADSVRAALRAEVDELLARQAARLDELNRRLADLANRPAPDWPAISADLEQRLATGLADQQARIDSQAAEFGVLRQALLARLGEQSGELAALRAELTAMAARLEESRLRRFVAEAVAAASPTPATRDGEPVPRGEFERLRVGFTRLAGMMLLGGALLLIIAVLAWLRG